MKARINIISVLIIFSLLQSCEWINHLKTKHSTVSNDAQTTEDNNIQVLINEKIEEDTTSLLKEEPTIHDFIEDVYLMANIKSVNSYSSSIKCETLFFIQPINKNLPAINFKIYSGESNRVYLDTTLEIQQNFAGVRYLENNNLYELNLGLIELGKNFKTRVTIPSLSNLNYIEVEPKKYNEIFQTK